MKKNGIFYRTVSGLLAAALTLTLTACGGGSANRTDTSASSDSNSSTDAGPTHLRLAYHGSLCGAPLYIAQEKGFFADENLEVEQVTVDAAHVAEAVGSDQVDVGMGLIGKMLQPLENGLPIKFTTGVHTGCIKLLVPADSGISKVTDLKGKNIGVPGLADAGTVVTKRSLHAAGIDASESSSEVTFTVFSRNDLAQALENGAVDAIVLGDPQASITQKQYGLNVLIDTASDPEYKDEYCCAAFVTNKLAAEDPEAAAAFTRAVQKSYNYKPSVQGGYDALKLSAQQLTEIGILKEGTDATKFADNAYIFFDDVPDAPESGTSTETSASAVSFQPAAAAAEENDCCGGGAVTQPVQNTKA